MFDTGAVSSPSAPPFRNHKIRTRLAKAWRSGSAVTNADALYEQLVERGTAIAFPPEDGPFGCYFAFRGPFGYTITAHSCSSVRQRNSQ